MYTRRQLGSARSCAICGQQFRAQAAAALSRCRHMRTAAVPSLSGAGNPPQPPARGGDGGDGGGGSRSNGELLGTLRAETSAGSEEVLVFDITGMRCGGCVSKVKKVLEQHPNVHQANVNLATEVALVRIHLPAKKGSLRGSSGKTSTLQSIADELIEALGKCGFESQMRDPSKGNAAAAAIVKARREERQK